MFGYVKTDFPNLYVKDTVLYKAMYCGLCKGIGKTCGQKGRLLLNYDLTFLSVFLHNVMGKDVKIEGQKCIVHQLKKRPVAISDSLTERIASLNVIMAYHKLKDDVIDSGKRKLTKAYFTSSYKKARANEPELDKIVEKRYKELLDYEKTEGDSVDISADPFGNMILDVVKVVTGDKFNAELERVAYNLGKWVYLIDALDDFDKDKKKKNFNVFINAYKDAENKEDLVKKYQNELVGIFSGVLGEISTATQGLEFNFNHDLIDNVLMRGLSVQTKYIMENKKCKNTTKF